VLLILDNTKTIRDSIEKSPDKQDEEHRVWYVGVTRTKQNLYVLCQQKRRIKVMTSKDLFNDSVSTRQTDRRESLQKFPHSTLRIYFKE
jgi:superfamily I DNA/RNA helicase